MRRRGLSAVVALVALTGCGSSDGDAGKKPTAGKATKSARAKGATPRCAGEAPADGLHVLYGGAFRLPGGGAVTYRSETTDTDGTARTAVLLEGERPQQTGQRWTVSPGQRLTVSGHSYTVSQICSYRVVLRPDDAKDRAAAAAKPASLVPVGDEQDNRLCFTTRPDVRAQGAEPFPPKGGTWSLSDPTGRKEPMPLLADGGLATAITSVDDEPFAGIAVRCAGVLTARYEVSAGDVIELAGVEFEVTGIRERAVLLTRLSD
ncbi:hypothetical protein [Streptomyces sp. NPDC018031]|uniref:hypothetical protein n=1 Tax=Streptomyces sp. NPDC018031 TaxID=3365033 RepID=UPI00379CCEEF